MQGVVTDGTASCCLGISGIPIAAKTGTAQLNNTGEPEGVERLDIAFAPADDPQYVVAVMLEAAPEVSASTGGRLAGPIAQRMFEGGVRPMTRCAAALARPTGGDLPR